MFLNSENLTAASNFFAALGSDPILELAGYKDSLVLSTTISDIIVRLEMPSVGIVGSKTVFLTELSTAKLTQKEVEDFSPSKLYPVVEGITFNLGQFVDALRKALFLGGEIKLSNKLYIAEENYTFEYWLTDVTDAKDIEAITLPRLVASVFINYQKHIIPIKPRKVPLKVVLHERLLVMDDLIVQY